MIGFFFGVPIADALTSAVYDRNFNGVVKLITSDRGAICSGTIVGSQPVTILASLNCVRLMRDGLYVDRSIPFWEQEQLRQIATQSLSGAQGAADFQRLLNQQGSLQIGELNLRAAPEGSLNSAAPGLPPPATAPLREEWKITRVIMPESVQADPEFARYERLLLDEAFLRRELTALMRESAAQMQAALKSQSNPLGTLNASSILSANTISILGKPPAVDPRQSAINAEIKRLRADATFATESILKLEEKFFGSAYGKAKEQKLVAFLVEGASLEGDPQSLADKGALIPIGDKISPEAPVQILGFGYHDAENMHPSLLTAAFARADRKITKNSLLPMAAEDESVAVIGLVRESAAEDFPKGEMGVPLAGDMGGAFIQNSALVAVVSAYETAAFQPGQPRKNWPDYSERYDQSVVAKGYGLRLDTPAARAFLDQAKREGADLVFRESGKVFR